MRIRNEIVKNKINIGGERMKIKNLIFMIIMVLSFFCGQLNAEEVVGESIFPCIEPLHPYPQVEGNKTRVWSSIIREPGAAWIKIHFSGLRLTKGDYVNLIDMEGRIIERIGIRDVRKKQGSKFKLQKNNDNTVSFWTSAVDGEEVKVQLNRTSNKQDGSWFIIDEVGVGSKPIFDVGLGPIYNTADESQRSLFSLFEKKESDSVLRHLATYRQPSGRMLYRKGITWYTCKGSLVAGSGNQFLPHEPCIDSQDNLDTLEVRFYVSGVYDESNFPVYLSYYGDKFISDYFAPAYGLLSLMNNKKMVEFDSQGEYHPEYAPNLSALYQEAFHYCGCESYYLCSNCGWPYFCAGCCTWCDPPGCVKTCLCPNCQSSNWPYMSYYEYNNWGECLQ
jgi:hypothetical protein